MFFVYMGGKHKLILAAQDFFCKLHADLMGLLRSDLPRLKGLDQVAAQVRSLVDGVAAGPGKFDIRGFGGAAMGGYKQLSINQYYLDIETSEWDEYDDGFVHQREYINYCPWCGRKLNGRKD